MARVAVLFDGWCRFCRRAMGVLQRLDRAGNLTFVDVTDAAALAPYAPFVEVVRLDNEMGAVVDGRAAYGYDAFRVALRVCLGGPLVGGLMALPPVRAFGVPLYRYIAARRSRLGCRI